ncbi:Mov34/MPN/PAD-1 family protein [Psychrobacillus lasiicapitis]|nr:M67 family metallopeptidase [Psychrobacillus lasiicapitis]
MNQVRITEFLLKEVIDHARAHLPYESCGLLAGTNGKVNSFWILENELKSDRRFFVSETAVSKTLAQIAERKENVIAIYHSHPITSPIPSSHDIINHPDPEVKMLIVSFKSEPPEAKCYHILSPTYYECLFLIET